MIVSLIVGLLCVLPVRLDNYGILLIPITVPEAVNRISVRNKVKNEILRDQDNLKPIKTNQELFRDNKIPIKSIKSKHNELLSDVNLKSIKVGHDGFWNDRSHVKSKKLVENERFRNYEVPRLDIENYDEPTETTDIDTVDYNGYKASGERSDRWNGFGEDKIVGGLEVESMNLYPYHVSYGTNCGGAIIGKKWVLTAGHCGKKPYVRVGSKYINQGRKVGVKKSFIHPQWSASNKDHPFDYDFQILELNENLKMDDNVQPVKIAHIEDMVIGKVITVTGWGNTEENGPYSSVLRAVRVPIISKENCQHVPFPYFRGALTARMFCAGFSEGKKDACQGDSGGPAVAYDRLLGMVSFGYGCATPGSYGVYSKVAKVRPWIQEVTGLTLD